ncbi:MAG: ATP-binding protein, partial [Proteobacteria bacterium]|nr:ATP-binding protein [Pseudomonadota bacterium]
ASKWMKYIFEGTKTMKELIDGLLSYSRVRGAEGGTETIDLDKIVAKISRILKATHPNLIVEAAGLPSLPGYPTQLQQLFQNLMQNAVKFRQPDIAPEIKITAVDKGSDYYFEVRDNGIGIAKEHFERVFLLFQRLHSKEKYEGTGLGLSICKKVVTLHGGRIWIESEVGSGSKFCFTLKKLQRFRDEGFAGKTSKLRGAVLK